MTYLPTNVFKHILDYCDDRIEQNQRRLWKSIKIMRYSDVDDKGKITFIRYCTHQPVDGNNLLFLKLWGEYNSNWCNLEDNDRCLSLCLEEERFWSAWRQYPQHCYMSFPLSNFISNKYTPL